MAKNLKSLRKYAKQFVDNKQLILQQWVAYDASSQILQAHKMDKQLFTKNYGSGVFDYFIGVILGQREIGNCPVMQDFLAYLKDREISAAELFELCSHFRKSMLDFSYDAKINSKELYDDISYLFDENFRGILKFYTDSIFQKLIDARQEAVMASQAKEYFLSNMSHEIRTPLNAILGFVNILLEDTLSKKHRNYLEIILNSGENLLSIINDILDFSKLRSGEFTIEPKVFSIHEEISHTLELFVASAELKEITLTAFIDPHIPVKLSADILRIKQIISNYLSNAIKFTPVGGHIHVTAECKDAKLCVRVKDNGVGIDTADQKNIFEAFAQAQYAQTSRSDGTGLGLSISHQLAELMNGAVGLQSSLGKGSTFWLEIPVEIEQKEHLHFDEIAMLQQFRIVMYAKDFAINYQHKSFIQYAKEFGLEISLVGDFEGDYDICLFLHDELRADDMQKIITTDKKYIAILSQECSLYDPYEHIAVVAFPLYCSKLQVAFDELLIPDENKVPTKKINKNFQGHLLVAEDNEANQELIKIILEKFGLTYEIASDGLQAVNMYKYNSYDLILMDEQMPKMDGTQAVYEIRTIEKNESRKHTPISALTANVLKGVKENVLRSGYDAFLGKPIVLSEFEAVLKQFLKPRSEQETSKIADNVVQINKKKLMEELMLNKEELEMLMDLFLKKMQTILPELLEAVKADDYELIAKKAHNIKGSSGNFRIKYLQQKAAEMEKMAKDKNKEFGFLQSYQDMQQAIDTIVYV